MKIVLPFKKTKHFIKMLGMGHIKQGVRISRKSVTFNFSVPPPVMRTEGKVVGLDKGAKSLYVISDGSMSMPDIHGHTFDSILKEMCLKKKGSKAFRRCQEHRKNYIYWCLNQIDLTNIKTINVEKLINMRLGKRTSRYLSHFTYPIIKNKLDNLSLETGVRIRELSPTYTSQRCSKCGWTCKANRKGKRFVCTHCGNTMDADLNASFNISFDLPEITKAERLKRKNLSRE
jgi:transposase